MPIPDLTGVPVLVTGGAGFIGSHLVDALLERGARVAVLDDLSSGKLERLARWLPPEAGASEARTSASPVLLTPPSSPLTVLKGDIRDLESCRLACGLGGDAPLVPPKLIFHQAAFISVPDSMRDPYLALSVNLAGTANLFTAAREAGVGRLVYASSSGVYGDAPELPLREGREGHALSPYSATKLLCEQLADSFHRIYGLESVGLRYFNVYGPQQDPNGAYAGVIPLFFRACLAGERPSIFGDGLQSRDFTFIGDAVRANLLAAGAPAEAATGRAFNIASGERVTIAELARIVREACGGGPEPERRPARAGDVLHSHADTALAREVLGFEAQVPIAAGLPQCLEYYRKLFAAEGGARSEEQK